MFSDRRLVPMNVPMRLSSFVSSSTFYSSSIYYSTWLRCLELLHLHPSVLRHRYLSLLLRHSPEPLLELVEGRHSPLVSSSLHLRNPKNQNEIRWKRCSLRVKNLRWRRWRCSIVRACVFSSLFELFCDDGANGATRRRPPPPQQQRQPEPRRRLDDGILRTDEDGRHPMTMLGNHCHSRSVL